MSVGTATRHRRMAAAGTARHPNEMDAMRVTRAIEQRERYRYVHPTVVPVESGYLVRSPCCSRNIDPGGGEIDVAWLDWNERQRQWTLLRKDHKADCWIEDSRYARLGELLMRLIGDPQKVFWQ